MLAKNLVLLMIISVVLCAPQLFQRQYFKVGVEFDHSLPMCGGSDRYRHRNNYDPFFVTVTASAKKGFVISYIEVQAIVDDGGSINFSVIRGQAGSRDMVFQIVSNHSDFLSYSYLAYGIREEEYKKITNIIQVPVGNSAARKYMSAINFVTITLIYYFSF